MLTDPISAYEQARVRQREHMIRAAREAQLRTQLPPGGPRVAIASVLRRLADRIDDTSFEPLDTLPTRN